MDDKAAVQSHILLANNEAAEGLKRLLHAQRYIGDLTLAGVAAERAARHLDGAAAHLRRVAAIAETAEPEDAN